MEEHNTHTERQTDRQICTQMRVEYRTSVYQIRQAHLYAVHVIYSMNTIKSMEYVHSRWLAYAVHCLENNEFKHNLLQHDFDYPWIGITTVNMLWHVLFVSVIFHRNQQHRTANLLQGFAVAFQHFFPFLFYLDFKIKGCVLSRVKKNANQFLMPYIWRASRQCHIKWFT